MLDTYTLKAMEVLEAEQFLQHLLTNTISLDGKDFEPVDDQPLLSIESSPPPSYSPLEMSPMQTGLNTSLEEESPSIKLSLHSQPTFDPLHFDEPDDEELAHDSEDDTLNNYQLRVQLSRLSFNAANDVTQISSQLSPPLYNAGISFSGGYNDLDEPDDPMELHEDDMKEQTTVSNMQSPLWCAHERGAAVVKYDVGPPITSPIHSRRSWLTLHNQAVSRKSTNDLLPDDIQDFSQDLIEKHGGFGQQNTSSNSETRDDWLAQVRSIQPNAKTARPVSKKKKKVLRIE
jgi:hypothetical protein